MGRKLRSDVADDDGDGGADPAVAMSNVQYPSSAGITFAVDAESNELNVAVDAARYEAWRAIVAPERVGPITHPIAVAECPASSRESRRGWPDLYTRSRDELAGARSVTVVLSERARRPRPGSKDATAFFQVGNERLIPGRRRGAVRRATATGLTSTDEDLETNALLYRDVPEFAIGHGCAADWERTSPGPRANVDLGHVHART